MLARMRAIMHTRAACARAAATVRSPTLAGTSTITMMPTATEGRRLYSCLIKSCNKLAPRGSVPAIKLPSARISTHRCFAVSSGTNKEEANEEETDQPSLEPEQPKTSTCLFHSCLLSLCVCVLVRMPRLIE